MRIVSGLLGGREFKVPNAPGLRPTTERVREAIFSTLGSMLEIENIVVADLFAGSGALAFEALSRGAAKATVVESNSQLTEVIRQNSERFGVTSQMHIVNMPVDRWFGEKGRDPKTAVEKFDLIFADPPYGAVTVCSLLNAINQFQVLRPSGILIFESDSQTLITSENEPVKGDCGFDLLKEKRYGGTNVYYYRKK